MTDFKSDQNPEDQFTLSAPLADQHQSLSLTAGAQIVADFDFGNVAVEKTGAHIVFRFDNNGSITLQNIQQLVEDGESPTMILQDGSALPIGQLLASLAMEEEVEPAAGDNSQASGGVSEYEDNPGAILDGVNKLDGLDYSQIAGIEPPDHEAFGASSFAVSSTGSNGVAPDTPVTPDTPDTPDTSDSDTTPPSIVVNDVGDTNDNTPSITGTAEPGSTVIIEVGDVTMTTTADASGNWAVTVPEATPLTDGAYTVTGTATDAAGNFSTDAAGLEVDTTAVASITLDPNITADDVLMADEMDGQVAITGSVGGDVQDGDTVTLTVNGSTYSGSVSNGVFSIDVPGSDLAADPDATIEASVTTTDALGNTASATDTESYTVNDAPLAADDSNSGVEDSPITGNVLANDTDAEGDALNVSDFSVGGDTYNPGDTAVIDGIGTISIDSDGDYTFTPVADWNGAVPPVSYTVSDGNQSSVADLELTVSPVNDAPEVENATISLSEEGLAGGIMDGDGSPDTTDLSTINGSVAITDIDGDTMDSVTLSAPSTTLFSGGEQIDWSGEGTSTLIGSAGGAEVIRVTIDETGAYTAELKGPIDHAGDGEDDQSFDIGVTASDGTASASAQLTINVEDDAPTAGNTINSIVVPEMDTNVMVVLDVSGSMRSNSGVDGMSRLELAQRAIGDLLDSYDGYGDVAVRIVTFGNAGQAIGDTWTSVGEAQGLLNGLVANGWTNYDDALDTVRLEAFDSAGKIDGAQNVAYFISDGRPTVSYDSQGRLIRDNSGINDTEESEWTQFLDSQGIDSYALGMGNNVPQAAMDPVAYSGIAHSDTDAIIVRDLSQLSDVLLDTVAPPTVGELMMGDHVTAGSAIGADDGFLQSLVVDDHTYTYDPLTDTVAVSGSGSSIYTFDSDTGVIAITTTNGGQFEVNMETGSYSYRAPGDLSDAISEEIGFTLVDADGDSIDGTLTLEVSRDGGTVVNLSGTDSSDVINGALTDDVIDGLDGNDMIHGHAGNDILVGGDGEDMLVGGSGDDAMSGGSGADAFAFSANGGEGSDTITDFDVATDVIRLADVLDADGDNDIAIADLLQDGGQNVTASVTGTGGVDVELTISNGSETTTVTLAGINASHVFDNDTTLSDLINHGLQIEPM